MGPSDLMKPGAVVLGLAAAAALGFAAGYAVARDPQLLRRTLRAVAGGAERLAGAFAETREEVADLWAEVREDARHAVEDDAFDRAATVAAAATTAAANSARQAGEAGRTKRAKPRAVKTRARKRVAPAAS